MNIEFETIDTPVRDFTELRQELIAKNKRFDSYSLRSISYSQLPLCCIGNAGAAMCSPVLVQQELASRRERYLNMEPVELIKVTNYLKIERMYDDVLYAIAKRIAPCWNDLNSGQQLCARLICLYNHVDNPIPRIKLAQEAFAACLLDDEGRFPPDVCQTYLDQLTRLAGFYPENISDESFRKKVYGIHLHLMEFLSEEQRQIIEKEQLQDFPCTSDCFKVIA